MQAGCTTGIADINIVRMGSVQAVGAADSGSTIAPLQDVLHTSMNVDRDPRRGQLTDSEQQLTKFNVAR